MDATHEILAANVDRLSRAAFPAAKTETDRFERLGRRSGAGKNGVREMVKGGRSPTLKTIAAVAQALGKSAAQLLSVEESRDEASPFPVGKSKGNST